MVRQACGGSYAQQSHHSRTHFNRLILTVNGDIHKIVLSLITESAFACSCVVLFYISAGLLTTGNGDLACKCLFPLYM